ncbi:DUF302 domain-containing protein [Neolewinella persica]|uniref:DUF302 domain-containing protein n=1 Tax=Neolewinella persica TaxID=70998 RepID=UPI00037B15F6|nr:DUF302 domain-containing protein [Neolewinella persica]
MKSFKFLLLFVLVFSFAACQDDDDGNLFDNEEPDDVVGLNYTEADNAEFATTYQNIITALNGVPAIGIVAEVNHSNNASTAGLSLDPTRVVLFGNPNLGTPLMQANQRAGLDLPQKMLVYQASDDDIIVAYNNTDYLGKRHGVESVSTLPMIAGALKNFAENASGETIKTADDNNVVLDEGIIEVTSNRPVDTVYNQLLAALNANPNLIVVAELDHQANAASVGMELRPTKLVVFGNPNLGTPLMQNQRSVGIDLPQKMLIYEAADGTTKLIYNDPAYLARRHGLDTNLEQLTTITGALSNLAAAATTE